MEDQKVTKKNLWMFPLGTIGRDGVYQLFNNFIMTFILFTRELEAKHIAAITAIMVAARIFDAINDPIMGYIIEKTRTKWGKFKPWLAIGVASTALVVITIFTSPLQGWPFIIEFGIIYFLYSITYTMHDISYWGMIPSLSSDADTRNQYTSRTTLFAGVGGTLTSILIPILTVGAMTIGGNTKTAYGVIAIVISVLSVLFICFTLFGVKEPNPQTKDTVLKEGKRTSVKDVIKTISKNKELLWIIIIFLLQQIGNGIVLGGIGSTYVYFQYGYSGGLYSTFTTIGMAATAILMITYPMITRKLTRKKLMDIMMIIGAVGYALMALSGTALASTGTLAFWVLTIGYMAANFGQYCFYLIMMISIMNTVEYNEYISGEREEAIIGSVRPFVTKFASALIAVFTSVTYIAFKVTDVTNKISGFEQDASAGKITEEVKLEKINEVLATISGNQNVGLLLLMVVVPFVLMLASYLLYKKFYTLDEDKYNQICEELKERKQAQKED